MYIYIYFVEVTTTASGEKDVVSITRIFITPSGSDPNTYVTVWHGALSRQVPVSLPDA
jgi:hypothetical protein